jgi:uncharacterized protein YcfJ
MCITRHGGTVRLFLGVLAAGLLWLGAAAPLAAQAAKEGTWVRVTAPEHMEQPCVGKVVSAADPLVVREKDGTMHYIPTHQVELLEVARRRDLSPEAFVGTVLGMAAGGVIGWAMYTDRECVDVENPFGCSMGDISGRLIYGMAGGVVGGLAGGFVGYRLTPERWRPVWQQEVQTHVGVTSRGLTLRLELPTR